MLNFSNPWELVIAVAMSAQTTDAQVNKVTTTLFKKYPTLSDYLKADASEFTQDISSVNYYKTKAKHILSASQIMEKEFAGVVPKTIAELTKLPGVGRKTANVVLANAFGIAEGIAVDTHVMRFAVRYNLTDHSDAVKIEQDLLQIIPQGEWLHAAYYMISYGREIAPARKYDISKDPLVGIYPAAGKVFRI